MSSKGFDRKHSLVIALALLGLGLATLLGYYFIYVPHMKEEETITQTSMILMDTVVDVRVDGRGSADLVKKAFAVMEGLEKSLSRFEEESEVSKVNDQAGAWVKVSPTTLKLIQLGIEIGEKTEGAFDITIGAVLDLWGFGTGRHQVPDDEELAQALATVDYRQIEVDQTKGQVRIPAGTVLDLGGIAKGFIVDNGTALLRQGKVQRSIINAGGDISVIGRRPDNEPWRVGVQDPDLPSDIRWILPLDNRSVVTSGDYQRYFIQDGQRWHHIIDPKTGYPARGLKSVTIVGGDAATSDALSTAVFVLGMEEGRALVEKSPNIEGILISEDDVWISPGLASVVVAQ